MRNASGWGLPAMYLLVTLAGLIATAAIGSCFFDTAIRPCGEGLLCPAGWICAAEQDGCVPKALCGNGRMDEREACDDGNNISGDGCSADCTSLERCGNEIADVAIGEVCDDGNTTPGDGCDERCLSENCGNLIVDRDFGEDCDSGPLDTLGCNGNCKFRRCGDGYVNMAVEECDTQGILVDTPTCDNDCTLPKCGDKHTNPSFTPPGSRARPEQCDDGDNTQSCNGDDNATPTAQGRGDCQRPACGDGYVNPKFTPPGANAQTEQCDDGGNTQSCNGDDNDNSIARGRGNCQRPACGDGYVNPNFRPPGAHAMPEQCDDRGNTKDCNGDDNDNSTAQGRGDCQRPTCGDGYVNPKFTPPGANAKPEQCDGGGNTQNCNGDGSHGESVDGTGTCQTPRCGDGYVNPTFTPTGAGGPEQCDPGDPAHGIPEVQCSIMGQMCNSKCHCS